MSQVPFIDLKRLLPLVDGVTSDWSTSLAACEFVGGPRVATLEGRLNEALGVSHSVACANGTDALLIALQVAGVKRGHKVALPNLTFWATYEAIALLGATPVLVDVDADDLQLSLPQLEAAHATHKLDAVLLVHLFGWTSSQLVAIREFCKRQSLPLVEDGAQCFGVVHSGAPLLKDARYSTLSFYPAKVIGGAMDGGAMLFAEKADADKARSLANHGRSQHYSYAYVGWNSRMGALQAAFLNRLVAHHQQIVEDRRRANQVYRELLAGVPGIRVYGPPKGVEENGYLCVLTLDQADPGEIAKKLNALGVGTARTYPETMDVQPPATDAIRVGDLQVSKRFCASVLNLPLFFGITRSEQEHCVSSLRDALK